MCLFKDLVYVPWGVFPNENAYWTGAVSLGALAVSTFSYIHRMRKNKKDSSKDEIRIEEETEKGKSK